MNDDWFDELLKDVNLRSKQRKNVDNNDITKNVKIKIKRDIDVLKYVIKTLKPYVDMNNVLKQLMTFDLDEYYENNVKKRRVMLNNVTTNVNNVMQNNVTNYDEQNDSIQQNVDNYDEQLLQQL